MKDYTDEFFRAYWRNKELKKGKEMNDQLVNESAPTEQPTGETPKVETAKPEGFQVEAKPAVDSKPVE